MSKEKSAVGINNKVPVLHKETQQMTNDKRLSFLHCIFLPPLSKTRWPYVCGFISGLSILFHWSIFLFLCQYHCTVLVNSLIHCVLIHCPLFPCFLFICPNKEITYFQSSYIESIAFKLEHLFVCLFVYKMKTIFLLMLGTMTGWKGRKERRMRKKSKSQIFTLPVGDDMSYQSTVTCEYSMI